MRPCSAGAPAFGGGPVEPPLLVLPPFPSSVPVFGAPAVLFLGMSGNDETVLEEAADFCSLTWIESIIILYTSSPADAFVDTAAAATDAAFAAADDAFAGVAAAAAAAAGDDADNAVFDAEDEDDDDGLLLNPWCQPLSSKHLSQ